MVPIELAAWHIVMSLIQFYSDIYGIRAYLINNGTKGYQKANKYFMVSFMWSWVVW